MLKQNNSQEKIQNLKSLAGSIAHETRNPLASIKHGCIIVKSCLDEAMEYLDSISTSADRGLMVSEMILTNIKEGEIDKSKFTDLSIANIVETTIKEYQFESNQQRESVNFDLRNDFSFKGDENLMIFVLFNLLRNSIFYQAKIDIWLKKNKANNYLYFKDTGGGIAADKLPYIFDDFFTSDKKGGTGLGLPFCKRVMKDFGGDITCESVEGEGVEFCLRFPTFVDCNT